MDIVCGKCGRHFKSVEEGRRHKCEVKELARDCNGLILKYCEQCDKVDFPKEGSRYLEKKCKICHQPLKGLIFSMPLDKYGQKDEK